MNQKDGRSNSQPEKSFRAVPLAMLFLLLCSLSFYLGGMFCSEKGRFVTQDITKVIATIKGTSTSPLQIQPVNFTECDLEFHDFTPCTDPKVTFNSLLLTSTSLSVALDSMRK